MPISITETSTRRASVPKGPEDFQYRGGRRYHSDPDSPYMMPNDQQEHDRLRKVHLICKYMLQKNYSAPVEEVLRGNAEVLDVGCGPGLWCIEMATDFPTSNFTGVDISNVFPVDDIPPNVSFGKANALKLPFPDSKFDYIFLRQVGSGITVSQWPLVIKELGRVLKKGGFLELNENALEIETMGPVTKAWTAKHFAIFNEAKIDVNILKNLHRIISNSECFDLFHSFAVDIPFGAVWKNDLARLNGENMEELFSSALRPWLEEKGGISSEEYDRELQAARQEWNNEVKTSAKNRVVVAKKM